MGDRRCRHGGSWFLMDARLEWCYRCGALREMRHTGPAQVAPKTQWIRPVGPDGENPWPPKELPS